MAAQEGDIITQRQQLVANGSQQRLMVSTGQIGPPDGAV